MHQISIQMWMKLLLPMTYYSDIKCTTKLFIAISAWATMQPKNVVISKNKVNQRKCRVLEEEWNDEQYTSEYSAKNLNIKFKFKTAETMAFSMDLQQILFSMKYINMLTCCSWHRKSSAHIWHKSWQTNAKTFKENALLDQKNLKVYLFREAECVTKDDHRERIQLQLQMYSLNYTLTHTRIT